MGKIMKPGRVVLILGGRYTGRKAVVVKVKCLILVVDPTKTLGDFGHFIFYYNNNADRPICFLSP